MVGKALGILPKGIITVNIFLLIFINQFLSQKEVTLPGGGGCGYGVAIFMAKYYRTTSCFLILILELHSLDIIHNINLTILPVNSSDTKMEQNLYFKKLCLSPI